MAGWLAGWLDGWLAGWLAVSWLVSCLVSWLDGWLAGWLAGWIAGWLASWLLCCLVSWLVGCLVSWLVSWVASYQVGHSRVYSFFVGLPGTDTHTSRPTRLTGRCSYQARRETPGTVFSHFSDWRFAEPLLNVQPKAANVGCHQGPYA